MSTIIISIFVVLFVLLFIMLIVITGRMKRDYEYKLELNTQHENEAFSADVIKTQEILHTISISDKDTINKTNDMSVVNFEIK